MSSGIRKFVLRDAASGSWLEFTRPRQELIAKSPAEVPAVLGALRRGVAAGLYAAGYIGYEAAPAFDPALETLPPGRLPLACFGLFDEPRRLTALEPDSAADRGDTDWQLATAPEHYVRCIEEIKRQIESGNCYQINYTLRAEGRLDIAAWDLFCRIAGDARYAAFLDFDDHAIVSASPELFFSQQDDRILCRPMKGTARRGTTLAADNAIARELQSSAKNRAENVMITDMIRNDLGRIAQPGSVRVESLYDLEKLATVWQMTSSVTARTTADAGEILAALFPCASVTGAPKAAAMHIIAGLEESPREVYTGAIGYIAPGRRSQFSVAIRTAWVDKVAGTAVYGTGSGVVWDSDPREEYDECLAKTRILHSRANPRNFELLETLLWTAADGYFIADLHLDRLQDSSGYFDFAFERSGIEERLAELAAKLEGERQRVRLRLARDGTVTLESRPLAELPRAAVLLHLAAAPVDASDPFLYHKTTRRETYEHALAGIPDGDEVLLWNRDGYVTETAIANVIVEIDGKRCTPPVDCGLLGGTYRRWLLDRGKLSERRIHIDELADGCRIGLINSVRGEYAGRLVTDAGAAAAAASS